LAKEVYSRIKCLEADDVADAAIYALRAPAHVNVNEIIIRPTEQLIVLANIFVFRNHKSMFILSQTIIVKSIMSITSFRNLMTPLSCFYLYWFCAAKRQVF